MKVENKEIRDGVLSVVIYIEREGFDAARRSAYLANTDRYPAPGSAPGLASLAELERTYGPAVLFDEALAIAIPDSFKAFLDGEGLRIVGKPEVSGVEFEDSGVRFTVCADLYPEVELGEYRGIAVPFSRAERQAEFEQAVVQRACERLKGEIPAHMVEKKLDALTAQQKVSINNDSVYHLLADMLVLLDAAYTAGGAVRPKVQVRREAMDLMLQTASEENERDWKGFLLSQLRDMVERYHSVPDDFDAHMERIIENRAQKKRGMTPDELTAELFAAYLGSLELTEEQWRNQRRLQAARDVCLDLLLDAVASKEGIEIAPTEIRDAIEGIAAQYGIEPEQAEEGISLELLVWKLRRERALALILNAAVTDEHEKALLDEAREKALAKAAGDAEIAR